ncbi:Ig-like protein group 2 [Fontibacillus phaseoli]|uniref:Ig-like protein group 2 n=1 Tax=Fontibacillus phaseoli TaxID=1416533 RepID=A0A369BMZ2_9BACL|nr:Ig-like domain-containing protein [Fontibacillus phaseoli]RCX22979.1 Ig-like protein group 2 [Fontibacillus phaseoli]
MTAKKKLTGWLLMLTLLLVTVFPNGAIAAANDVVAIDIEGSGTTLELTVGKTKQLKLWGTVEGSSVKRDLTNSVTWTSSDGETIKVTNGFLTALKAGTVTIRADHAQGATSTIEVKAKDSYKELSLEYAQDGKYSLGVSENPTVKALAAIQGSEATKDVTADAEWSSSNSSVLTIEKGKLTLVGEGTATVTAKYSGLTATFTAKVNSPYSKLKLKFLNNDKELSAEDIELVVGDDKATLQAWSTLASDSSELEVTDKATWTSSDKGVVTVEGGKIKVLAIGKATLTAEYLGVKAQTDIYVRAPYEAILLDPSADQSMFIGETLKVEAEVRSGANNSEDVTSKATWTSSNPLAATVSGGEVSAKATGTATIKVSHSGISKSFKVTVNSTITKLTTEKTELELYKGESLSFPKVTGTKLDDEQVDFSKEVTWTSGDDKIAKVEDGKIVGVGKGEVTLTAKLPESKVTSGTASPIRSASVTVKLTVKEKVLALISEEERLSAVIGEDTRLPVVTAVWEDGEESSVPDSIEWSVSGSNAVIKTTSTGKVLKGLTKGSATLKGTYSNKTISIPVTIEPKIVKVVVDPVNIDLNIKKSKSIKVTGFYKDGKKVNLSSKVGWESSNSGVAMISSTSVKAVAEGTATLKGFYQGHNLSVKVNVIPKLVKLTVDEKSLKLAPGSAKTVVLTAQYDNGNKPSVTGSATWTSSKPSVAKVTAGKIEAVAKGSATIKAVYGGKTVTVRVTVK